MTIAQIAGELGRSTGTVRHWMRRFGLQTQNGRARRPRQIVQSAKGAGLLSITMTCRHHGETEFFLEGRGYYRCKRCRSEAVARRRRQVKAILVEEAGGRCRICGYDQCIAGLEFHHRDPLEKRIGLSARGIAHAVDKLREEAKKCILLCSNCHAEVENGVASLPLQ